MKLKPNVYVIVIHTPTGQAYTLNRGYGLVDEKLENANSPASHSDWDGWREGQTPEWAAKLPKEEFFAYWPRSWRSKAR